MLSSLCRYIFILLFMPATAVLWPATTWATKPASPAQTLLKQMRQAHGGDHWTGAGALVAKGGESSDGLKGPLRSVVDLHTGYHATRTSNGLFPSAAGCDAHGCWYLGSSGMVHAYDSAEAVRTAVTRNWLARFGFLFPRDSSTIYRRLPDVWKDNKHHQRLEAMPAGGQVVTLWIDPGTHRLERAIWHESFLIATQRYADYRRVEGLWLPFRITDSAHTLTGSTDSAGVETITHYRVLDKVPDERLQRPDNTVRDVTMAHGATRATSPMQLDGGALLIEARINDEGPLLFILDTGGHAILTAHAAKKLGLASHGAGSSTGSGPGAMSTAYTKVAHLTIGNADIRNQTFLVMPLPYPFYERGPQRPIAGILGLEIFQRFAVTFDYDHHQLVLQPFDHGAAPPPGKGMAVPLSFTYDMPSIHAELDGRPGTFGIDTGNSGRTLIFPQWASRKGLFARYAKGSPLPTGGVGGKYTSHISHARSLQLGGVRVAGLLAQLTRADAGATGNPTEAGNIGQDVLSRFNVHFDYRRRRMYLAPRAQPHTEHFATAGLAVAKLKAHPDRLFVGWALDDGPAARAGLKRGDTIIAVNGTPATQLGSRDFRDLARDRPEGTHLHLTCADGRKLDIVLRDVAQK